MHFDLNFCAALAGVPTTDVMATLLANYYKSRGYKQRCPFKNVFNFTVNADNSSSTVFFDKIPRMPQGDYKMSNRMHTKANETIFGFDIKLTVRSKIGVNRTTMLDMG